MLKTIVVLLLISVVAFALILPQSLYPVVKASPAIEIDGNVEDWDIPGVSKFTDEVGDTEGWSKDPKVVGIGSTAESPDKVEANDKCRDIKAVYFYADENWIYIRLDVVQLYPGWCLVSKKHPEVYAYPNVSSYHLYFRVPGSLLSPQSSSAGATDTSLGDFAWHFNVQFDAGCTPDDGYAMPFLQWPDWSGVTVTGDWGSFAVDLERSSFEMKINRALLEEKLGTSLGNVYVFIASAKLGEPEGAWGKWAHAFEPQNPGDPGEGVGGSDFADYMPNNSLDVLTGTVRGPLIEVNLSPYRPPEEAPKEAPAFPIEILAAVAVIVIVAVVAIAIFLRRKKK
ncbi:MAG: hypothetical protein NZ954_05490 [Thermofilaceae archaeon]|nr:hypothetical protein [Thermofilaceae archaeon]MCX8180979.1 hypothetical protein [Thermofilaceae archaeon]MDW8004084.1 hypothetical protein [Thermofilaceae archaeon]